MKYDDELQSGFGMYQAYPFYPFLPWEDEKTRDQRRFRELYPMLARRIQPLVEKACDMQEYEGSFMFDEYPDQLSLMKKSREIWNLAQERKEFGEAAPEWEQMQDLIGVLLLQEMLRRRKRQRMQGGSGILLGK